MVLTTSSGRLPPPQRGTTLPAAYINYNQNQDNGSSSNNRQQQHAKAARAHTLPNIGSNSGSKSDSGFIVQSLNLVNSRKSDNGSSSSSYGKVDRPMDSRMAPAAVSILSLPNSDNEGLNFDNR